MHFFFTVLGEFTYHFEIPRETFTQFTKLLPLLGLKGIIEVILEEQYLKIGGSEEIQGLNLKKR